MSDPCPICHDALSRELQLTDTGGGTFFPVVCRRCTGFKITDEAVDELGMKPLTPVQIGTISGWLRVHGPGFFINTKTLAELRRFPALPVGEQADRLLLHFARENPQPAEEFPIELNNPVFQAVAWAYGQKHLIYLYRYLVAERFITEGAGSATHYQATIAPSGWAHVYALQHTKLASPRAFIAMFFDESLDALRDVALMPAIEDAGYDPFIVNKHPHNSDIMAEIISGIRGSRFMVADFTGGRQAVYYEAGIAFGLGHQIIHTCQEGKLPEIAFDINHNRFLEWDPGKLDDFRARLTFQVESTIGAGPRKKD